MIEKSSDEQTIEHYVRFWGEPVSQHKYEFKDGSVPDPVVVLEFGPSNDSTDWVYATVGVGRQLLPIQESETTTQNRRIELFIYANTRCPILNDMLVLLAKYPFRRNTFFAAGHLLHSDQQIVSGSFLTDLLVAPPRGEREEFWILRLNDNSHVHPLWVVPICRSEREYAKTHGWSELEKLFYLNRIKASDLLRKCVV